MRRFLSDHDFREPVLHGLATRFGSGFVCTRLRQLQLQRSSDDSVLAVASGLDLIVLSHDVRTMTNAAYGRIANGAPMSGLVVIGQLVPTRRAIDELAILIGCLRDDEWEAQVHHLPL